MYISNSLSSERSGSQPIPQKVNKKITDVVQITDVKNLKNSQYKNELTQFSDLIVDQAHSQERKRKKKQYIDFSNYKNCIDLICNNPKMFRNAVLQLSMNKKVKNKKKKKRNHRIDVGKQKLVLKLPTMISVCIDQPTLKELNTDSDDSNKSDESKSEEIEHKRRKSNNRYKPSKEALPKIKKYHNQDSRPTLQIKETLISDSIILPAQLNANPSIKTFTGIRSKFKLKNSIIRDAAISQFLKNKQL